MQDGCSGLLLCEYPDSVATILNKGLCPKRATYYPCAAGIALASNCFLCLIQGAGVDF